MFEEGLVREVGWGLFPRDGGEVRLFGGLGAVGGFVVDEFDAVAALIDAVDDASQF